MFVKCYLFVLLALSINHELCEGFSNFFYNSKMYGGHGGREFEEAPIDNAAMFVRRVYLRTHTLLDSIQVEVSDGEQTHLMPVHGGFGGDFKIWEVPNGEFITEIEMKTGAMVDSIIFITDKGTRSPRYGGDGGSVKHIQLVGRLVGLRGRAGAYIDALGFISM